MVPAEGAAGGAIIQRRFALVDGADVLASATQYNRAAVLDQQPVRVCGIGSIRAAFSFGLTA